VTVLVILPGEILATEHIIRAIALVRKRYAQEEVHFAAPEAKLAFYAELMYPEVPRVFRPGETELAYPEMVILYSHGPYTNACFRAMQRVYVLRIDPIRLNAHGGFILVNPSKYDERVFPWLNTHVFNQLSSRSHGLQNFAFGQLYLDPEVGPIDPFGFRIVGDFRDFAERHPLHKLVALTGGSTAFSCLVMHDEMFATLLEQMLNSRGGPYRYTVLNFGMHGRVVMEQLLIYLLFIQGLRPDVVISHAGNNDEWWGLQDDRYLLNHHQIIYQRSLEEWSRILHDTQQVKTAPLYSTTPDVQSLNLPQKVIKAYLYRVLQFKRLVESDGAIFIHGHQPLIWSKGALTADEERKRAFEEDLVPIPWLRRMHKRLRMIHPQTSEALARLPGIHVLDLHRRFAALGAEATHFWDNCHCSPAGEREVARLYFEFISELEPLLAARSATPSAT
jgi:hypothetical protein